ncbi:hypothetical protein CPB83DRAFT_848749 [Crepidotus variabilis]|uniref:Uncharacterized protein n=1 Tax=Crepidotus variabilis TaxID=179855 RepID=A0A9P6EMS3_9AGAR|nr:hypothetical protein CPB83DRAFT_848749 [Crepidotus variabilis]
MDPISITCAVITLATAVKDLVELGIKLKASCAKVANNQVKLERLCVHIIADLERLEQLYKRNRETLDGALELEGSVIELPKKGLKNIGSSFKAWWKADELEAEVSTLKEHVVICHSRFLTFAAARIELKAQEIHAATTQIDATTQQTQNQASQIQRTTQDTRDRTAQIQLTTQRIEQRLLILSTPQLTELRRIEALVSAKSSTGIRSPIPMRSSQRAPRRSNSLIAQEYLCMQVDNISQTLSETFMDGVQSSLDVASLARMVPFYSFRRSADDRHRSIVRHTLELLQALEQHPEDLQRPVLSLFSLSCHLSQLDMHEESETLSGWCVELLRKLEALRPEVYRLHLSMALHNLATDYQNTDLVKATPVAEEAVTLIRSISGAGSLRETRNQLALTLSTYSCILWMSGNIEKACSTSLEAVSIAEDDLRATVTGKVVLESLDDSVHSKALLVGSFSTEHHQATPPIADGELVGPNLLLYTYSWALLRLSWALNSLGRGQESYNCNEKRCKVLRYLVTLYADTNVELDLAQTLWRSADDDYRTLIPVQDALVFIDEAVAISRRAASFNKKRHTPILMDTLLRRAVLLWNMDKHDGAYQTWAEVITLGKEVPQQQLRLAHALFGAAGALRQLDRVDEGIILRSESVAIYHDFEEHESFAHLVLASDYLAGRRFQDARKSAEIAVSQHRQLAFKDPTTYALPLMKSLYTLANILNSTHDYALAFVTITEAVNLADSLIPKNPRILEDYLECLDTMMATACGLSDREEASSLSQEVIRRLRQFDRDYPSLNHLVLSVGMNRHGFLLFESKRVEDGLQWWQEVCRYYEENVPTTANDVHGKFFAFMNVGCLLRELGRLKEARLAIKTAISIGKPSCTTDSKLLSYTAVALSKEAEIVDALGDPIAALDLTRDSLAFCLFFSSVQPLFLATCLARHAISLLTNEHDQEALKVAQEAVDLLQHIPIKVPTKFDVDWVIKHADVLKVLAWSTAHTSLAEAIDIARKSVEKAKKFLDIDPAHLMSGISESSYGDALYTLGCMLLFSGDHEGSVEALSRAKDIWHRRTGSSERKLEFRELILTLRAQGICYRLLGRQDEETAIHAELNKIMAGFKVAYPSVHQVLSVAIEQELRRRAWVDFTQNTSNILECPY